jgi:hypothetical protein
MEVFMKRFVLSIIFCVLSASAAFAQTKTPVEGVWKVAEVVRPSSTPAEKGTTNSNPQPGLIIFTRGYYSQVMVTGAQPRATVEPAKDPQNLTDAEKIARYDRGKERLGDDQPNAEHSGVQTGRPEHALADANRGSGSDSATG